jgi:hypothetical protein
MDQVRALKFDGKPKNTTRKNTIWQTKESSVEQVNDDAEGDVSPLAPLPNSIDGIDR